MLDFWPEKFAYLDPLFANMTAMFAYFGFMFANMAAMFADIAPMFANAGSLFPNVRPLFADIRPMLDNMEPLSPDIAPMFDDRPVAFANMRSLFANMRAKLADIERPPPNATRMFDDAVPVFADFAPVFDDMALMSDNTPSASLTVGKKPAKLSCAAGPKAQYAPKPRLHLLMANYGEAVYGVDYYGAAKAPGEEGRKGRMAEIAFKFARKTPAQIRQMAVDAKAGLTNNPNFPDGAARATALGTKITAYDTTVANRATAEAALTAADDAVNAALEDIKTELTGAKQDCEKVTRDAIKLGSTQMPLRSASEPVGDLPAPANFSVTRSDAEGAVDGQCHKVDGASTYKGEYAVNRDGPWQLGYEGTKSSFTQGGLTPGQMVYFRMAAFGPNGWSPWSDIAQCRVA